ncbi:MAG: hypothetical protein R3F14_11585 [Polyangiaceae bacterium]
MMRCDRRPPRPSPVRGARGPAACALLAGCGGNVINEGRDLTGGGTGGEGGTGGNGDGGAASCDEIECSTGGLSRTCETHCDGPDLRATCKDEGGGQIVCECHYDDAQRRLLLLRRPGSAASRKAAVTASSPD